MSGPFIHTRRAFLRQTAAFSALSLAGSLDKLGLSSAAAQTGPGYKALVCVFLFGGNDANHMVLPVTDYTSYSAVRDPASTIQVPIANLTQLAADNVTPLNRITPTNPSALGKDYALHPALNVQATTTPNPTLRTLFANGNLAVVANCGTLVQPMTRAQFQSGSLPRPDNLFSHSDQQQEAMSSITRANVLFSITGWGGRLADKLSGLNAVNATPMSMSFSGSQTFGNGVNVRSLALPTGGTGFGYTGDSLTPNATQAARAKARANMIAATDGNAVVATAQQMMAAALNASQRLSPIIAATGTASTATAPFVGLTSSIALQLRAVAKVIENRVTLGHDPGREIFFVSMGGFDSHTGQAAVTGGVASLYTQLGQALSAFYQSTAAMGVANSVTTFTASDFSRTFKPNGAGTDHAWGAHHLVMGGSVVGTKFYGTYPTLSLAGPDDTDSSGRWIPTTSIEQLGATLGKWFGVTSTDLPQIFPNLGNFATPDLGFMA